MHPKREVPDDPRFDGLHEYRVGNTTTWRMLNDCTILFAVSTERSERMFTTDQQI